VPSGTLACMKKMPCNTIGSQHCRCGQQRAKRLIDKHTLFRKLWSDHSGYTNLYLISAILGSPLAPTFKTRLLENQREIGHEMGLVLGKDVGKAVGGLLTEHIVAADAAVNAAVTQQDLTRKVQQLFTQGDHVARALSDNLHINYEVVQQEFHTHNKHVLTLANLLLKRKWAKYQKELDCYLNHMMHLSDLLTDALSEPRARHALTKTSTNRHT